MRDNETFIRSKRYIYTHTIYFFTGTDLPHLKISAGLKNNLFLKKDYILNIHLAFVYIVLLLRVFSTVQCVFGFPTAKAFVTDLHRLVTNKSCFSKEVAEQEPNFGRVLMFLSPGFFMCKMQVSNNSNEVIWCSRLSQSIRAAVTEYQRLDGL